MAGAGDFGFWLGEWRVSWEDADGPGEGRNTISERYGGRVVHESFDGRPGVDLVGMSVSVYDPHRDCWLQTWVDDSGNYFHLEGRFEEGVMTLLCDRHSGERQELRYRMRFFDIADDSFSWTWERSEDAAASWELLWQTRYERLAVSDAGAEAAPAAVQR
jgi:Protein of unknown function (DUF1579)